MVLPGSCPADPSASLRPAIANALCGAAWEWSAATGLHAGNRPEIPLEDEVNAWLNEGGRGDEGPMRRLRILLVEDDGNISALIVELLANMGHDVCGIATTEGGAVVAAERLSPDLMIVDVVLSVGGGISAMATILRRTAMPHIFMTGGSRHGIPHNAAVLHKPFGMLVLTAALDGIASQIAAAT